MSTARDRRHARAAVVRFTVRTVCVAFAFALIIAVVGDRGLLALRAASRDRDAMRARVAALRQENESLRRDIRRLQDDPSAIEERARRDLGLIKPGEIVFTIREVPAQ